MASCRKLEASHTLLARQPRQPGGGRKEIRCVGGPGVLPAVFAVTKKKTIEFAAYFKGNFSAQARSGVLHDLPLPVGIERPPVLKALNRQRYKSPFEYLRPESAIIAITYASISDPMSSIISRAIASELPVLPPVYSTTRSPGTSSSLPSAPSTVDKAIRSFTLPVPPPALTEAPLVPRRYSCATASV